MLERIRTEAVGEVVVVQGWDSIMLMLESEGPYPVRAVCRGVTIERNEHGHQQAYLLLEEPEAVRIPGGYDGFGQYHTGPHGDGLYRFNLADVYEISIGTRPGSTTVDGGAPGT
ncbi:MAG: hypothetical protein H6738_05760 [Alphaproteobacteria bacterium]|nr:hypothetical protein [Alphaproteobacteria bacterium]MCB9696272.1 hypothetical protein [Alphaproteobacteria bacterium]